MRMMRAVEFASRLGFAITPDAYEAILRHRKEIVKSAPPRVTEELAQSLRGGPRAADVPAAARGRAARRAAARARRRPAGDRPGPRARDRAPLLGAARRARRRAPARPRLRRRRALRAALPADRARPRARGLARRRAGPARLSTIIEDVVSPLAFRMSLPRAATDRIKQALSIVGKLSHRPDGKLATRRLAFREAFAHRARPLRADRDGDRPRPGARPRLARPPGEDRARAARPARSRRRPPPPPRRAPPPRRPRRRAAGRRLAGRRSSADVPLIQLPRHPSRGEHPREEPRRDPARARTSARSPTASARRTARTAILEASHYVELYDDELDEEVYRVGVHTLPAWLPDNMEPEACVARPREGRRRAARARTASS